MRHTLATRATSVGGCQNSSRRWQRRSSSGSQQTTQKANSLVSHTSFWFQSVFCVWQCYVGGCVEASYVGSNICREVGVSTADVVGFFRWCSNYCESLCVARFPYMLGRAGQPFIKNGLPLLLGTYFYGHCSLSLLRWRLGCATKPVWSGGGAGAAGWFCTHAAFTAFGRLANPSRGGARQPFAQRQHPRRKQQDCLFAFGLCHRFVPGALCWTYFGFDFYWRCHLWPQRANLLAFVRVCNWCSHYAGTCVLGKRAAVGSVEKKPVGAGVWVRRVLGAAALLAALAIALGWDTSLRARLSLAGTQRIRRKKFGPGKTVQIGQNSGPMAATFARQSLRGDAPRWYRGCL